MSEVIIFITFGLVSSLNFYPLLSIFIAIDEENTKAMNRIKQGSALQVASGLPILNIPYIGTGLGGAMYETGNAIMQGKPQNEVLKDTARGFAIGESVGAIPYIGKFASKTKTGQAIGEKASNLFNKLKNTEIGRKYNNQPSLYEKISGIQPSTGAATSNLYEYLKKPKANYNYEKELNIFNDYPPNIDPNTLRVTIGDVSNDSYNLGLNNGYNLENFKHTLDNSSYNHFLNGHYGINEKDERLLPLGENDIKYIPNIIYYPDSIEFLAPTKRKLPRIKYSKLANNGNYIYVEELQNNKKRLNTKTMWKEK